MDRKKDFPEAEKVLKRHGVGTERQEVARGPRAPKKVEAILQEIRSLASPAK